MNNRKIVEYEILKSPTEWQLSRDVNVLIKEGYETKGKVFIEKDYFFMEMVKYEECTPVATSGYARVENNSTDDLYQPSVNKIMKSCATKNTGGVFALCNKCGSYYKIALGNTCMTRSNL